MSPSKGILMSDVASGVHKKNNLIFLLIAFSYESFQGDTHVAYCIPSSQKNNLFLSIAVSYEAFQGATCMACCILLYTNIAEPAEANVAVLFGMKSCVAVVNPPK